MRDENRLSSLDSVWEGQGPTDNKSPLGGVTAGQSYHSGILFIESSLSSKRASEITLAPFGQ